jgi:clan AA aspartic protease (TIGR02281 family)
LKDFFMLKADREDRNGGLPPRYSNWKEYAFIALTIGFFVGVAALFSFEGHGFTDRFKRLTGIHPGPALAEFYAHFNIEPLPDLTITGPMAKHIATLLRERCDWDANYAFAVDLQQAGYSRQGAKVFLAYSHKCKPSNVALSNAADAFYGLSDFDAALKVSDELLALSPDFPQFHYQRAQILQDAKRYREAIDAYDSTIGLAENISTINGEVFRQLSASYAALGEYCEAITPIQTWISIDPTENDTPRARKTLKDYSDKGHCEQTYAKGSDRFPTRGQNVIKAKVSINGVPGTFIVDTGASFVSLSKAFAERAKLPLSGNYSVRMNTATGVSMAQRSSIGKVEIGRIVAEDVAAIVMAAGEGSGDGIDGLLGRSFLARFDVTFGAKEWRIESKK